MISSILEGWYSGKGNKCTRHNNYEKALFYYEKALTFARKGGNIGSIAITLECIARTYIRLNDQESAIRYAEEGLDLYQKDLKEIPFKQGAERLEKLISSIKTTCE